MMVVLPDTKGFYLLSIFMHDIQSFRNPILAIEHTDNQMFQNENVTVFPSFFLFFNNPSRSALKLRTKIEAIAVVARRPHNHPLTYIRVRPLSPESLDYYDYFSFWSSSSVEYRIELSWLASIRPSDIRTSHHRHHFFNSDLNIRYDTPNILILYKDGRTPYRSCGWMRTHRFPIHAVDRKSYCGTLWCLPR
jgi:hypothetical protein